MIFLAFMVVFVHFAFDSSFLYSLMRDHWMVLASYKRLFGSTSRLFWQDFLKKEMVMMLYRILWLHNSFHHHRRSNHYDYSILHDHSHAWSFLKKPQFLYSFWHVTQKDLYSFATVRPKTYHKEASFRARFSSMLLTFGHHNFRVKPLLRGSL